MIIQNHLNEIDGQNQKNKGDSPVEPQQNLQHIVLPLLSWYDKNARILPWRENTNPYPVWVSEIMLQQTRVEAVIPYFQRFMDQLPTLHALATAPEEQLLKLWEGLGYYSRVRNLQKSAQIICSNFDGIFPENYKDMLSLPGIGPYTAGAISSISFNRPIPAIDGNVLRVIARLTEDSRDLGKSAVKKQYTALLEQIYPKSRSGDFTQSLMELGAIVCLPNGVPKCEICPLSDICLAFRHNSQSEIPVKGNRLIRRKEYKTVLLLCFEDKIAIRKRHGPGVLSGLWEFVNLEGTLSEEEVKEQLDLLWGISTNSIQKSVSHKHIFSHIEWHMISYRIDCQTTNDNFLWITKETLEKEIPLPTAFKKFSQHW